jgi:hypothetical protein
MSRLYPSNAPQILEGSESLQKLNKGETMKYTISVGNLAQGFQFYGIFDTSDAAHRFANQDADLPENWLVVQIYPLSE